MTIARQLWVGGAAPKVERFNPPANDPIRAVANKPHGGLWTSTYAPEDGSAWVQWCLGERFHLPHAGWKSWLLEPDPTARVLTLDTYADLEQAIARYGIDVEHLPSLTVLDFERLALDFDAVHLTEEGQWATRLTWPLSLYGWDCEATLWLRWAFTSVISLGTRRWTGAPAPELRERSAR